MKKAFFISLALAACAGAFGQVQLYNNINGTQSAGFNDVDGGIHDEGINQGGEVGQVLTDVADYGTISNIEGYYVGYSEDPTSGATGLFVQVFNYSGGVVGSLVGEETVGVASEHDSLASGAGDAGFNLYDIDANLNISGLVGGHQYLVAMQVQSPTVNFQVVSYNRNADTYIRDFSNSGYSAVYGEANWTESGAYFGATSYQSDTVMKVEATPEPISLGVLGFGVVAMLRRRRRA